MGEKPSGYRIEPAADSQFRAIAELLHLAFGGGSGIWLDRFDHAWARNPAWNATIPRGWAATAADGRIDGYMMNTPFRYDSAGGRSLLCGAIHTLAVRPEARGRGLGRAIAAESLRQDCDFVVGTQTSPGGWGSLVSAGMAPLGEEWTQQAKIVVADAGTLAKRAMPRLPGPAAYIVAKAADAAAGLGRRRAAGLDVEPVGGFDEADDEALRAMEARPAAIRPRRNSRTLNWMYFGTPHLSRSRIALAARSGGRLVGYAGFRLQPGWLQLLECRTLPGAGDAIRALIEAARSGARERRMSHILVYPYSELLRCALPRALTLPAPPRITFPYLVLAKAPGLRLDEIELGPWDGDAVTMDDAPALDGTLAPGGGAGWA